MIFASALDQFFVLVHGSDRHPHVLGKPVPAGGPDDHALFKQLLKYFLSPADPHQNKIGLARNELEPEPGEFLFQIIDALAIGLQAALDVFPSSSAANAAHCAGALTLKGWRTRCISAISSGAPMP